VGAKACILVKAGAQWITRPSNRTQLIPPARSLAAPSGAPNTVGAARYPNIALSATVLALQRGALANLFDTIISPNPGTYHNMGSSEAR